MTEEQIHSLCEQYYIKNYIINEDMSIDVNGNVRLWNRNLYKLPLKFNKVSGWFDCSDNELTTLEGSPIEVGGNFWCSNNKLTSLEGCSIKIGDSFWCYDNELSSLEGGPKFVNGHFYCDGNPIFEEFYKFKGDYNLYIKYKKRQKVLNHLIN